jgi:hypothetical protein
MKPAYPDLLPALTDEEYARLKNAIETEGLLIPIEIDADKPEEILDGWHRFKICEELGREISDQQKIVRRFADEAARKWHCFTLNVNRRHMTKSVIAQLTEKYGWEIEAKKAKARSYAGSSRGGSAYRKKKLGVTLPSTSDSEFSAHTELTCNDRQNGAVATILGQRVDVSRSLMHRAHMVAQHNPTLAEDVIAGRLTVEAAHRQIKGIKQKRTPRLEAPFTEAMKARIAELHKANVALQKENSTLKATLKELLKEYIIKRKEVDDQQKGMNKQWRPEVLRAIPLHNVHNWMQDRLEAIIHAHSRL